MEAEAMRAAFGTPTSILRRWLLAVVCLAVLPGMAGAAVVAMVTDVVGSATISAGGKSVRAAIAGEIESDAQLDVAAGASVTALYLDSGVEYIFKGPSRAVLKTSAPDNVQGEQPQKRQPTTGVRLRVKPAGLSQGAMVMRSAGTAARIRMLSPVGSVVLETQPAFMWQELQAGIQYHIEISDDAGRMLYEAQVQGTTFQLPEALQLKQGLPYAWSVSARLPNGRKYFSMGEFRVASAEMRDQVRAASPTPGADVATRVTHALWLEQVGLRDDARKLWRLLAAERPTDETLRNLAER